MNNNGIEDFKENLISLGFNVHEWNQEMLLASTDKIRIRILFEENLMQFGMEESFDRWANSVDYSSNIPSSKQELEEILADVRSLIKCHYCFSWNTPHKISNRFVCDVCYKEKHKRKFK